MKRIAVFVCLIVLGSSVLLVAQAPAQPKAGSAEQELIRLENEWGEAILKRDVATLGRLLADDFKFGEPDGTVTTKTQLLDFIKTGDWAATSIVCEAMQARVYGDAAVVEGLNTEKSRFKGVDSSGQYRWTDTWIRRDGRWQCVAGHSSKVAQPPPPASSVEKELIELEKGWGVAMVQRDVAFLDRIFSEDMIDTDNDGVVSTRAQMLTGMESGEVAFTSFVLDNMKVHAHGDAAVVFGRTTLSGQTKGKDISGQYQWTDTWVKKDGRWQCVATHGSKVSVK